MERKYESSEEARAVAKEAVFLAWQACGGTMGFGVLQDRGPNQDREKVWDHAYNERDYSGRGAKASGEVNCDYVMGRMMKLRFEVKDSTIVHNDYPCCIDYQAWCHKYPTFDALFTAAEKVVRAPDNVEAK